LMNDRLRCRPAAQEWGIADLGRYIEKESGANLVCNTDRSEMVKRSGERWLCPPTGGRKNLRNIWNAVLEKRQWTRNMDWALCFSPVTFNNRMRRFEMFENSS
jgi:hypothetical protein